MTSSHGQIRQGFERPAQLLFGVTALLFVASSALTIILCNSMSSMGEMPMPGSWTMSMAWMRMPGHTWIEAGASFVGMWIVMMIAMMLPSITPVLLRYEQMIGRTDKKRFGYLTALMTIGYFFVWAMLGIAVFSVGATVASFEMRQPTLALAVPISGGIVVLIAGLLQFTTWKDRHLACCREIPGTDSVLCRDAPTALRHGLRFGAHCTLCCAGLTVILLVIGVMNLRTMALVGAAITLERLAPATKRVAQAIGAIMIGLGVFLILRAVGGIG
jgi:predicted metal-binding membrane protein